MAERIRILRVIARLNVGGPAIHVTLATAGLDPAKYETRLLAGDLAAGEGDMEWFAKERGVAVEKVPGLGREIGGGDLKALAHLRSVCREFKPHIVHTHTAKAGGVGRVAAMMSANGAKRVHTFHGHVLDGYFGPAKQAVFRQVERWLASRTDTLVVPAQRIADDLVRLRVAPAAKFRVVPLGFELDPLLAVKPRVPGSQGALRKELKISGDAMLVGMVGRLTAIKNHAMLIAAAAHLKRRTKSPLHFVMIGDGELREELVAETFRKDVGGMFSFAGWRKDIPAIYEELDIVALTSKNEGTPVTLIEAMAAGRPVVATAVGGVPDVIEDGRTGILIDRNRDDLFAVAVGRLADEADLRERLTKAARVEVAARYRVDRLIADLDALYGGLLDRGANSAEG